jgi:hypothetical protein
MWSLKKQMRILAADNENHRRQDLCVAKREIEICVEPKSEVGISC